MCAYFKQKLSNSNGFIATSATQEKTAKDKKKNDAYAPIAGVQIHVYNSGCTYISNHDKRGMRKKN